MIFDKERKVHFLTGQVSKVNFYETGQVFSCDISNDLEIDGKSIPAGSKIVFTETGAIDFFRP